MGRVVAAGNKEKLGEAVEILARLEAMHIIDYDGSEDGFSLGSPERGSEEVGRGLVKARAAASVVETSGPTSPVPEGPIRDSLGSDLPAKIDEVLSDSSRIDDLNNEKRCQNASNTIETLIELDVIPIINENDSVATEEIQYGDNDQLAARVCELVAANCLILFSDVDGLYDDDPKENPNAKLIKTIREITPEIEMLSNKKNSEHGSGGIETKIKAAKVCLNNNCNTIIANGMNDRPISIMKKSDNYTIFLANENA